MEVINFMMIVECLIVTEGQLILELWVSELGVEDIRANKDAENGSLLPNFPF